MKKMVTALIVPLCLTLVGCGPSAEDELASAEAEASASAEAEASTSAEAEARASAEAEAKKAANREAARAAQRKCKNQLGSLLDTLLEIDGRLDVGITPTDFGTRLGDVAVSYNQIPISRLEPRCVHSVGVPLENAYNEYSKSKTKWDACIDDYDCSVEGEILEGIQEHWAQASKLVDRADRSLGSTKFLAGIEGS